MDGGLQGGVAQTPRAGHAAAALLGPGGQHWLLEGVCGGAGGRPLGLVPR